MIRPLIMPCDGVVIADIINKGWDGRRGREGKECGEGMGDPLCSWVVFADIINKAGVARGAERKRREREWKERGTGVGRATALFDHAMIRPLIMPCDGVVIADIINKGS